MKPNEYVEALLDRIEALARGKANLEQKVKRLEEENKELKQQLEPEAK